MYKKERLPKEIQFPQRRRTPSFSSSLLDSIYRSIDESNAGGQEHGLYREHTLIQKQSNSVSTIKNVHYHNNNEVSNLRRSVVVEGWVENQKTRRTSSHYNSTSSSWDSSSYGGGFFSSSSEAESKDDSRRPSNFTPQRNNPISEKQKKCSEGGFAKTKLRAMKFYGELKKVKQPISPGGRIASFLNSIFGSGSAKKVKMCSTGAMEDVTLERKTKSTCSSATSFSRSCLSKTPPPPSSRGKPSNGTKRSVRFCPVSVIVDEDCRPCGHKCIYEDDPGLMPIPLKNSKCYTLKQEVPKGGADYVRRYQNQKSKKKKKKKRNMSELNLRGFRSYIEENHGDCDDNDDDDVESCSSSDLFELDHLIGIGRYREELPVYETTNLRTNHAIANGFIL